MNVPSPSRHRVHFRGIASRYAPHLTMMGTLLAIGVGLLLMAVSRPGANTLIPGLLFFIGSLGFLIPIYLGLAKLPREVEVTPSGLKWVTDEGEHESDWDDVQEVYRYERITNQTFREAHLDLVLKDGYRLELNQCLSDFDELGDSVQAIVCKQRAAALRADLQSAGAEFGPVTLRRAGILIDGMDYTWDRIDQIVAARGCLNVQIKTTLGSTFAEVAIARIPNFPLFMGLLHEVNPASMRR